MAQAQTNTTTSPSTNGNTNGNAKREVKPLTPLDAVAKISKILKQLSATDRKRVLDFVGDGSSSGE
jgi:hypothetical protein